MFFHCDFNLHSLMANDSEHTFMCLLIIYIYSFVMFLFKSFAFIVCCFIIALQVFYILQIQVFRQVKIL